MLTELKLSNFRIFNDEVTVRFRPITVFIGRNSSGKSSIIKFLLMLQQSIGPGKPQFLSPEGDSVRLGNFSGLKNSLSRKRNLTFGLKVRNLPQQPSYIIEEHFKLLEHVKYSKLLYQTDATISYSKKTNMGYVDHSLVDGASNKSIMKAHTQILDDSAFLSGPEVSALVPEIENALESSGQSESKVTEIVLENFIKQVIQRQDSSFKRYLIEQELLDILRYQINSLRHLSPVRDESQRVILMASPPVDYVGQNGQHALPHIQQMITENEGQYEFIRPHLEKVADIERIKFRASGSVVTAFAKSRMTGAEVLIADYGFGVSQCLPIFVQGAIMRRYTSLMVEQPEAQLHPTAQLEMGSYFADLWNQRKVGSIIETHSDNILLRLRRLIAKGELSHQDVSVAFFTFDEENENMPIIKNLDINEDGSMEAGLPMEFFGANVIEGLRLGAKT